MTWLDFFYIMNLVFIVMTIVSVWRNKYIEACLFAVFMVSNQISILTEQLQPLITK